MMFCLNTRRMTPIFLSSSRKATLGGQQRAKKKPRQSLRFKRIQKTFREIYTYIAAEIDKICCGSLIKHAILKERI